MTSLIAATLIASFVCPAAQPAGSGPRLGAPLPSALDCNTNLMFDADEITGGTLTDANTNGIADECEPFTGSFCIGDMNADGFVDGQDIPGFVNCLLFGVSNDVNDCEYADVQVNFATDLADLPPFVSILLDEPGAQRDSDGDGTPDCSDGCPFDGGKTAAGVCGCGTPDTDTDGDATPDCVDNCPLDGGKTVPGVCGCGTPDVDSDGDGALDCNETCPNDSTKFDPGVCGCGVPDEDSDGDSVLDCNDGCPNNPDKIDPGVCGCGLPETDGDGDGVLDCVDNCPTVSNADQADEDGDGFGDVCSIRILCPFNLSVETTNGDGESVVLDPPIVLNAAGDFVLTVSAESGDVFPVGSTTVTATAFDTVTGRTDECSYVVTVTLVDGPGPQPIPPDTGDDCAIPREPLRWILMILYRAPICGMGCPAAMTLSLVGWFGMRSRVRRGRRT